MAPTKPRPRTFPITTFISDLQTDHIFCEDLRPDERYREKGRLVIVGDVHGMRKSLVALLDEVEFIKSIDHLVLVGDLVNKGPDSAGVLDIAMNLGASAVRGNHDNEVLNAAADIKEHRESLLEWGPMNEKEKLGNLDPAINKPPQAELPWEHFLCVGSGNGKIHTPSSHKTAEQLSQRHLDWLAGLPLILRISLPEGLKSPFNGSLTVVHAGLVPDIPLEKQDPHTIMHMRGLIHLPYRNPRFIPEEVQDDEEDDSWIEEWDEWQDQLEPSSRKTVVFGHDAKRRIQRGKYAFGLDSGCLYGNKLSALVIWRIGGELIWNIASVKCADTPVGSEG